MQRLNGNSLRIAIQSSGRLTEPSIELLQGIGLDFEDHARRLFSRCRNFDLEILFVRDDDIPEYGQDRVADLGIVGRNVFLERAPRALELERLGFGRCSLCLAVPVEAAASAPEDLAGSRIATTHPNALRRYLAERGIEARVIEIQGAAELAPALDVSDAICDLVSTGTTLRMHDLRPLEELWESEAILIANPDALEVEDRRALIDRLRVRIQGLLTARRLKYVTLNAPADRVEKIRRILPGMKSPTVVPLAEEGMVALHAAVEEEVFWDVMERIKAAGGSEILVLPVEKVMP
ncbi:MAG: ATP phosphoribosyltransferase [Gemmatimonadota bacterium]|nr:ATP phosphoribosyltransferase [Gemmatimonadota bacterium]